MEVLTVVAILFSWYQVTNGVSVITPENQIKVDGKKVFPTSALQNSDSSIQFPIYTRVRRGPPFTIIRHKTIVMKDSPKSRIRVRIPEPFPGSHGYKFGETKYSDKTSRQMGSIPPFIFEKPIDFDLYDSSFKGNTKQIYVENYTGKVKPEYIIIDDWKKRNNFQGNKDELNENLNYIPFKLPPGPVTNENAYDIHTPSNLYLNSAKDIKGTEDSKKNEYIQYNPDNEMIPILPSTELQLPVNYQKQFKSDFSASNYLPPRIPAGSKILNNMGEGHNSNVNDIPEAFVEIIPKEVFDSSKLPLEDVRKHPNFNIMQTSYQVPIYEHEPFEKNTALEEKFPPNLSDAYNEEQFSTISKSSSKVEITFPRSHDKNQLNSGRNQKNEKKISTGLHNLHSFRASLSNEEETTTQTPQKKRSRNKSEHNQKLQTSSNNWKTNLSKSQQGFDSTTPTFYSNHYSNTDSVEDDVSNFVLLSSMNNHLNDSFAMPEWEATRLKKGRSLNLIEKTEPKEIQVILVQKSQSHSYYDGTIAPDAAQMFESAPQLRDNIHNEILDSISIYPLAKNHRYS